MINFITRAQSQTDKTILVEELTKVTKIVICSIPFLDILTQQLLSVIVSILIKAF